MQTYKYKVVFENGVETELSGTAIEIDDKRIITVVQEIVQFDKRIVAMIPPERLLYISQTP